MKRCREFEPYVHRCIHTFACTLTIWLQGFQHSLKMAKSRTMKDGSEAEELDKALMLQVYTRCPSKWKLFDSETGQWYVGTNCEERGKCWAKIDAPFLVQIAGTVDLEVINRSGRNPDQCYQNPDGAAGADFLPPQRAKDPLVASKTPTSEGVAEWLNDHVDANALRDEAYNIKKQINRKKVALIKARKKLKKVVRLNAKGRNKPDGANEFLRLKLGDGAASTWTAEGTKIKLDPDEGQQIWKSAFEIRREEKEKEEAAEAGQPRRGKKRSMALYAAECEEIFKEMDGHKDVLPKDPHPFDATYERTFGNGQTHVPGRKKRRQLKNLHHPGAIKVLMPVAAAALAVKKQEKKEYVIVSDSDDDDEGSRNMPKLLAPQARAAAARQAWLSEVDNIEHELDRINEQFESYKKQKHIGNTTVGTATATTTTAVAQPSVPVKFISLSISIVLHVFQVLSRPVMRLDPGSREFEAELTLPGSRVSQQKCTSFPADG
eukprot:g31238.t1